MSVSYSDCWISSLVCSGLLEQWFPTFFYRGTGCAKLASLPGFPYHSALTLEAQLQLQKPLAWADRWGSKRGGLCHDSAANLPRLGTRLWPGVWEPMRWRTINLP